MASPEREHILRDLPSEIRAECRRIADEIKAQRDDLREDKIIAARMRMCSGYYDSDLVIRAISNTLLTSITPLRNEYW